MNKSKLPAAFDDIDIGDLIRTSPADLLHDAGAVRIADERLWSARALKYSRASESDAYDEIGFRFLAAAPSKGDVPLQTIPASLSERDAAERTLLEHAIEDIRRQQKKLRHRPIELPTEGKLHYRYEQDGEHIHFHARESDTRDADEAPWTFPLASPPQLLLKQTAASDAPLQALQHYRVDVPGTYWLPFAALIRSGAFRRMQDCRGELVHETAPGGFYIFLSHRWLSRADPDPAQLQARFVAWQLVAAVCDAVRIAHLRGLRQPRRFSPFVNAYVGVMGSGLAESLIVNVLRTHLEDGSLAAAAEEVRSVEATMADAGIAAAKGDVGLKRLRQLIDERPVLRTLVEHVYVWYDYCCLPQRPRDEADEQLFREGVNNLLAIQLLSQTTIVLDEADDYLSRAWCTLEALVADSELGSSDLLIGSARRTVHAGETERFFSGLIEDRPHLLWRALLDTELFQVQDSDECMRRLNLAATERADVAYLYQRLRTLPAPRKIHIDPSEVVTGAFPLPRVDNRSMLMPRKSGRSPEREASRRVIGSVDWTAVLRLSELKAPRSALVPPFEVLERAQDRASGCHVAVIGSCEGEAVLLAGWVRDRRSDLRALGNEVRVTSVSWLASDIAPVGHFVCGHLTAHVVDARLWLIVASEMRLRICPVTIAIIRTLEEAGIPYLELAVDRSEENVFSSDRGDKNGGQRDSASETGGFERVALSERGFPVHVGGLFRSNVLTALV